MNQVVYFNARFLTQPFSGVQRFGWELAKRLVKNFPEIKIVAPQKKFWQKNWNYNEILTVGREKGVIWEQIELPYFLRKKGVILLNPGNTAPLFYEKNIVINHGLSWKRYPEAFSLKFKLWYDFLIPRILKKALLVFTVSEFCKEELIEEFKISEDKIEVIYPGISEIFKPLDIKKDNTSFILYVGNIQPYKNLKTLIKAFQILTRKYRELELWIAGISDKKVFKSVEFKGLSLERIKFLGYKDDKELSELYNKAICLVLPSFYETFGFPVVEAMACGCPVIVSDIPALREVVNDAAILISPYNAEELAEAVKKIIFDQELRENLIKKGFERVKKFSWENTAKNLIKILEKKGLI